MVSPEAWPRFSCRCGRWGPRTLTGSEVIGPQQSGDGLHVKPETPGAGSLSLIVSPREHCCPCTVSWGHVAPVRA